MNLFPLYIILAGNVAKIQRDVKKMKELAKDYFKAVNSYDPKLVGHMITEDYIQHNPNVASGKKAFLELLLTLQTHKSEIINYRLFQDQDHVIMHHKWINAIPFGAQEFAAIHIIRFNQDKKIAEHWNVTSTNLDFAGPREIECQGRTLEYKNYIRKQYKGKKLHRIFGEENFVLAIFEEEGAAKYHLHYVKENTIENLWKIHQLIPTKNLKNQNTMFNFSSSF